MSGIEAGGYDKELDEWLEAAAMQAATTGYPSAAEAARMARLRLAACLAPGWWCAACGLFMGDLKEKLQKCRGCVEERRDRVAPAFAAFDDLADKLDAKGFKL